VALCQRVAGAIRRARLAAGAQGAGPDRGRTDQPRWQAHQRNALWSAVAKSTTVTRYVARSRSLTPAKMLAVTRAHWSIENHLHWTLDVVFDEDDARTRKDYGPENLAVIRRWAQNILRMHPASMSMSSKMRRAMWSKEFFYELFTH